MSPRDLNVCMNDNALTNAGVPLSTSIAGVAMGLILGEQAWGQARYSHRHLRTRGRTRFG